MNILEAAGHVGLELKKVSSSKGGEWAGPCPSCGGTDRFRVWPADRGGGGSYWCRQSGNGCGAWGDLVQFLVDFCGYRYRDAFKAAGREMPENWRPSSGDPAGHKREKQEYKPRVYETPVETWRMKAGAFLEKAREEIKKKEEALLYLERRGLDLGAVEGFGLGWFSGENEKPCMFRPRESWGLPTVIKKSNGRKKMLWIPRGLVIPCFKNGEVYRIRIRRPAEDLTRETDSKYYIIPGSGMDAMGFNPDRKAFVVVESELDGMLVARKAGSLAGVVALGAAQNKPGSSVYHRLQNALRVLVALDFDTPGMKAWNWWEKTFRNARYWPVPDGKDPGEAYEKGVNIKDWVSQGLPPAITMDRSSKYKAPEGVSHLEELRLLLARFPVRIRADRDSYEIQFDPGFRNRDIRRRIKDLFIGDDEVHWYLRYYHKDSVIHGDNCFVGREWVRDD